jgi:DinB superfamily
MHNHAQQLRSIVDHANPILLAIGEEDSGKPRIVGGWSARQITGHLIDSVSNNHQRIVRAALAGGLEWPDYDQDGCVRVEAFQDAPWDLLVETWSSMNRLLAHILDHLPAVAAGAMLRIGQHPAMTLEALAGSYISHMQHHLEQLGAEATAAKNS